jgi:hypothetical protein
VEPKQVARIRYVLPTGVAFACLHDGEPDRVEHEDLNFADPEVTGEEVDRDGDDPQRDWTVCGILEHSWRTVRIHTTAASPRVGYLHAWEYARTEFGGYLLLAAVHPGRIDSIESFGYADPLAHDDDTMRLTAARWLST